LTGVKWQQIFTVLKSTLEKLALVGVITVDQQEQAVTLTKNVGEEIAALIKQQNALEKEFERLVLLQHDLKHQTNRIRKEVIV
jgi:IQ domain-containing protein G